MSSAFSKPLCTLLMAATMAPLWAADFAPKGARATLSVEYVYLANGKKSDKYDSHEWKIRRVLNLSSDMVAGVPMTLGTQQAPDAQQLSRLEQQKEAAQKMSTAMAPMAKSVETIVAKCGDDEKCMEREISSLGNSMAGSKQLDKTLTVGRETNKALQSDAVRYQTWRGTTLKGTFDIDEWEHFIDADPICESHTNKRCQRTDTRKGAGPVVAAATDKGRPNQTNGALVEFDSQKNTMVVRLPVPPAYLTINEIIVSDKPDNNPSGRRQRQVAFEGVGDLPPILVTLKLGWYSQSGEQTVKLGGSTGAGQLKARWNFVAQ